MTEAGRLGPEKLDAVVRTVCERIGVDSRDAQLLKFTNNAVVRLAHSPVVIRIAASRSVESRVDKVVNVARWLAEHGFPAVRLVEGVPQPVKTAEHLATVWHAVPPDGLAPDTADLARLLRAFHALTPPDFQLPGWDPVRTCRDRLHDTEGLPAEDARFLLRRCDEVEAELTDLRFELPPGPIHGDAFLGNLLPGRDGPVCCDFDSTTAGPREWDLIPVAFGQLRFGRPASPQRALADAYGFDVTRWPGYQTLSRVRELQLVTSVVPVLRSNPRIVDQWRHRLRTVRDGDRSTPWQPYH